MHAWVTPLNARGFVAKARSARDINVDSVRRRMAKR